MTFQRRYFNNVCLLMFFNVMISRYYKINILFILIYIMSACVSVQENYMLHYHMNTDFRLKLLCMAFLKFSFFNNL